MNSSLEIQNLEVFYGEFKALTSISLKVEKGQIVSILGANGAGKSTLLKTMAGLLKGREGSIHFNGIQIDHLETHHILELGLALVPEGRKIFSNLTVQENLLMGSFPRRARKARKITLDKIFTLFPRLKERSAQMGTDLSGGEQQMLAIGRALMSQPRLILFDEISLGLSPIVVKVLFRTVQEINREGMTVVMVEQDIKRSLKVANYAYILQEGKIALEGVPAELSEEDVKRAYFGLKA
ncbi:MAG: ABC transporter ATP-binding protein [Deltaproteobacteria bacterium]|nr:ABC transporter ATP-binding protein [Deltaproteobacteria bacterium]